jgi:tetratricopeptide (TPR) repeat protein
MKVTIYLLLFVIAQILISCNKEIAPSSVAGMRKQERNDRYEYYYVEGIRNRLMGSNADAVSMFEECIKLVPERDGAWYQLGQIAYFSGDMDSALKYGKEALARSKTIWHYMLVANAFYQNGIPDSAVMYYERAHKSFPEAEDLKYTLGNLYYEAGYYKEAQEIFRFFDDKYSMGGTSAIPLVRSLIKLKKYDEAEKKLLMLRESYPEEYEFSGMLAELYRDNGKTEKAAGIYEELINTDPDNIVVLFSITDFFRSNSNYSDIFSLLNNVALKTGLSEEEKVNFFAAQLEDPAIIKEFSGEYEISLRVLEASHADYPLVFLLRPELYRITGRTDEAIQLLEIFVNKWPETYYPWEKLLLLMSEGNDYEKLYSVSSSAVRRFNTAILPRLLNAMAATEIGFYDEALEQLIRARRLLNDNQEIAMQILSMEADALYRKGETEAAFEKFDQALAIEPNDLVVLNNYAYFLAEKEIRVKEARRMIDKVIQEEADYNVFNDTYAWILYKQGKFKKAERVIVRIIQSDDNDDAEYFEHYGYILKARKKCPEAIQAWEQAIEKGAQAEKLVKEIEICRKSIK